MVVRMKTGAGTRNFLSIRNGKPLGEWSSLDRRWVRTRVMRLLHSICLLLLAARVVADTHVNSIIEFIDGLERGNTSWTRLYDSNVLVKVRPPLASTAHIRNSSLVVDEILSESAIRSIADVEMSSKWPVEIESWLSRPSRQLSLLVKHLQPGAVRRCHFCLK